MNISGIYNEETHKVYNVRKSETIVVKKEYKRSALGGKFKVIKYYDKLDLLRYVKTIIIQGLSSRVIIPNEFIIYKLYWKLIKKTNTR